MRMESGMVYFFDFHFDNFLNKNGERYVRNQKLIKKLRYKESRL